MTEYAQPPLTEARLARELDPFSTGSSNVLALIYFFQHDFDKSLEEWNKSLEMSPTYAIAHCNLSRVYETKSAYDKSVAELEQGLRLEGSTQQATAIAETYQRVGYQGVLRIIIQLWTNPSTSDYAPTSVAHSYLVLGDEDQEFVWLNKAYEAHSILFVKVDPDWDNIRSDPRFQDLLRRMNLQP